MHETSSREVSRRGLFRTGVTAGIGVWAFGAAPAFSAGQPSQAFSTNNNIGSSKSMLVKIPEQVKVTEALAPLPNAKISYWDTGGSGVPIVLLHPGTGSGAVWEYQQPVFAKAGYRVIGYSRRGYWGSEAGPENDPGTPSGDLLALMDHLKIDKFHAVGCAAGGIVALDTALVNSKRIQSLVLSCTHFGITDESYLKMTRGLRPKGFDEMPAEFREVGPSYRAANPEGTAKWVDLEHKSLLPGTRIRQPYATKITYAALEKLNVPTFLICGDSDLWAPPSVFRMVQEKIKGAEAAIIAEAGHSAYWEQPEAFNALVLDFIGRNA